MMDDTLTPRLAAAARADDTTLHLGGDYLHLPEEANHGTFLVLSPGTPREERITYERRVGPTLIGVRRGLRPNPQAVAEYVVPVPPPKTDLDTIVKTLRFLAAGWLETDGDRQWVTEVADEIEAGRLDTGVCPLCQEVECDEDCPLELHRWEAVRR